MVFNPKSVNLDITGTITFTIANNASLSDASEDLHGVFCLAVVMPGTWTAASLTFQASIDGVTFTDMYYDGAEYAVVVAASQYVVLDAKDFVGIRYLKIRSGTTGSPVNQGGARTLTVVTIPS